MLRCLKIMVLLSRMSAEIVIMVRCNHAGDEERRSNVLVFVFCFCWWKDDFLFFLFELILLASN